MVAPILLTINGVPYPNTSQDSIVINAVLGKSISSVAATIYDKNSAGTVPSEDAEIVITRPDTGGRIFGGLASMVTGYTEGVSRYWDIQGQSYNILLDRILFYRSYQPSFSYTSIHGPHLLGDLAILANLFETAVVGAYGNTGAPSEIVVNPAYCQQGSTNMGGLTFTYQYAREAVELIANYVKFNYYIDFNKNLHYYYTPNIVAPYGLSSVAGETLSGLTTIPYNKLKWKRDGTRILNNFVVFGANIKSDKQQKTLSGNGSQKAFSVAFAGSAVPLSAPPGEAKILVFVNIGTDPLPNWDSQTVGIASIDSPGSVDVIYDPSLLTLTFNSAPPNLTKAVLVAYAYTYSAGRAVTNNASVTKYGRTFSNRLIASDANTASLIDVAISHLDKQFSSALEVLTCTVNDSSFPVGSTARFEIGQYVPLHHHLLGINKSYWINKVTTRVLGGQIRSYDLEMRSYTLE